MPKSLEAFFDQQLDSLREQGLFVVSGSSKGRRVRARGSMAKR